MLRLRSVRRLRPRRNSAQHDLALVCQATGSAWVVEGFDVIEDHGMGGGAGGREEGAEALGLEGGPEGLDGSIVVAVGFATHALGDRAKLQAVA